MDGNGSILPLTADHLGLVIDGKTLVDDISFTLAQGVATCLLGHNGAGKSLLLRLCHGLLAPSAGRLSWNDGDHIEGRKRHAMVFQKPVMLRRSVLGNMTHALSASGWRGASRRERAREALARFALDGMADRPARRMSGGEQQRIAIARAWALDPEVMFLDEPTSALDPSATRRIEEMLEELKAEGRTLIFSTHDMGQARRLAQRVLFLNKGRLIEDAPADTFFDHPASREARAFLAGELLW